MTPTKKRIVREESCVSQSAGSQRNTPRRRSPRLASSSKGLDSCRDINYNEAFGRIGSSSVAAQTCKDWSSRPTPSSPPILLRSKNKMQTLHATVSLRRDPLPSPDRQSVHYPGFDIHYDTYVEIKAAAARVSPNSDLSKDGPKENLAPRRKLKKVMTDTPTTSLDHMKDVGKHAASAPASASRNSYLTVATPRPYNTRSEHKSPLAFTAGQTLHTKKDTATKRRAMKEEMDEVCSDIDENVQL